MNTKRKKVRMPLIVVTDEIKLFIRRVAKDEGRTLIRVTDRLIRSGAKAEGLTVEEKK